MKVFPRIAECASLGLWDQGASQPHALHGHPPRNSRPHGPGSDKSFVFVQVSNFESTERDHGSIFRAAKPKDHHLRVKSSREYELLVST